MWAVWQAIRLHSQGPGGVLMARPEFHDGDVVMLCWHLFECAAKGHELSWKGLTWHGRFEPAHPFRRMDGTEGACSFVMRCGTCAKLPETSVNYVEEVWRRGQLHVADFVKKKAAG